jgi:uncharacterized membrane protein
MAMQRQGSFVEYLRGSLWVMPALGVVVALGVGAILSQVSIPQHSPAHVLAFQGTADDARNLLIAIASTMVTVIALVLGLLVVALTLASTQYSPRLLRTFLRDRVNKVVLSIFVATFAYSAAELYTVGISGGKRTDSYPQLAVSGAIVLLFISLAGFVYQVDHISHSIQVDAIMLRAEDATQAVIRRAARVAGYAQPARPDVPHDAIAVRAARSGYVETIQVQQLLAAADRARACVELIPRVGTHVVSGVPIAWVWSDRAGSALADDLVAATQDAIRLGFERTMQQDGAFGIRQLVDIASKALSPAVNDPYTGVQAVDRLAVIMATVARRDHGDTVHRTAGGMTVTVPGYTFSDYLALSCDQIRRFGASEPAVVMALIDLLDSTMHQTKLADRHLVIMQQLALVVADAEREIRQPADLTEIREAADKLISHLAPAHAATER